MVEVADMHFWLWTFAIFSLGAAYDFEMWVIARMVIMVCALGAIFV